MLPVLGTCACHATPATRRNIDSISPKQLSRHREPTFNRRDSEYSGWTSGHSEDTGGHSPRRTLGWAPQSRDPWRPGCFKIRGSWPMDEGSLLTYLTSLLLCVGQPYQCSITAATQPQPDVALPRHKLQDSQPWRESDGA